MKRQKSRKAIVTEIRIFLIPNDPHLISFLTSSFLVRLLAVPWWFKRFVHEKNYFNDARDEKENSSSPTDNKIAGRQRQKSEMSLLYHSGLEKG